MIGIIFVIICAGLLVDEIAGESSGRATGGPLRSASGWVRALEKNLFSLSQQKMKAGKKEKLASNSLHCAPCTLHLVFSGAEQGRLSFRHTVSISEKIRARFNHIVAGIEPHENTEKSTEGVIVSATPCPKTCNSVPNSATPTCQKMNHQKATAIKSDDYADFKDSI